MAKYYYNGVLLPEIPADVLANYPYAWIRDNGSTGKYDLVVAPNIWYYAKGNSTMNKSVSGTYPYYSIPKASYLEHEAWEYNEDSSLNFGLDSARTVLWSGFDIPNGSATATDMYFFGTEAVSEDSPDQIMEYIQTTAVQYINTGIIPDDDTEIEMKYSVQSYGTYGSHMLSCAGFYFPFPRSYGGTPHFFYSRRSSEARVELQPVFSTPYTVRAFPNDKITIDGTAYNAASDGGKTITATLYMCTYGGNPGNASYTGKVRIYYCKIWQAGSLIRDYVPMWSKGIAGMYDKVQRKFYASEGTSAFFAGPMLGSLYDRKYLIRMGGTLYTISSSGLTPLTETEVTADLFRTYGFDEVPTGNLYMEGMVDPELLYWQDSQDELPTLTVTVKGTPPLPQMFTSEAMDLTHESIAGINYAEVDASEDVRFAISFDGGTTWKAFDGAAWFEVSDTAPGMLASTMNAITAEQWAEIVVLDSYMVRFWLPNVTAYVASVVMHYINP